MGIDYGKGIFIGREERQIRGIMGTYHIWRLNKLMEGAITAISALFV